MPPENDNLVIDGTEDEVQLTVQGHSTQTNPLQQWEKSDGTPVAKLHDDARLQVGDEPAMATPETLIEAHRDDALSQDPPPDPQGPPQVAFADRGLHTSAHIEDEGGDANIEWSVHEVTLGDGTDLGKVTALRAGVTNQGNGAVDEAVGLEIADITGATDNYAIKTGQGVAQFGDALELAEIAEPEAPNTGVRLYAKSDKKLYMRPAGGSEQEVGSGGAVTGGANQVFATPDGTGGPALLRGLEARDLASSPVKYRGLGVNGSSDLAWMGMNGVVLHDDSFTNVSARNYDIAGYQADGIVGFVFQFINMKADTGTDAFIGCEVNGVSSSSTNYHTLYTYHSTQSPTSILGGAAYDAGIGVGVAANTTFLSQSAGNGHMVLLNPFAVGSFKYSYGATAYTPNGSGLINMRCAGIYFNLAAGDPAISTLRFYLNTGANFSGRIITVGLTGG